MNMVQGRLGILMLPLIFLASCSDSSGPDDSPSPGTFTLDVRGPVTLDLDGSAVVYPGLTSGSIQVIQMLSTTASYYYRLEITFSPARVSPGGTFAIAAGSAVQATFFIVDRSTNTVTQIAAAQSGTLTLSPVCTLTRCTGSVTGQFPLGSTVQLSTITASFNARLT